MRFSEKMTYRRFLYSKPTLLLLILIAVFVIRALFGIYSKVQIARARMYAEEEQLVVLKKRQDELIAQVKGLEDEGGVEREIRDRFRVAKEGEKMILVVGDIEKKPLPIEIIERKTLFAGFLNLFR